MKKILYAIIIIAMTTLGCKSKNTASDEFKHIDSKIVTKYNQDLIENSDNIVLDSFVCSFVGNLLYDKGVYYFVDKKFCKVYEFGADGKLVNTKLGQGKSSEEIDGSEITGFVNLESGAHAAISSITCGLYDKDYNKYDNLVLSFDNEEGEEPVNPRIYTLSYQKFIVKGFDDNLYYSVSLEHPRFNFIENERGFYDSARSIIVFNHKTGEFIGMLGKYPEIYKNGAHNQFSLVNFDVNDKGDLYLSYEADKGIYVYDKDLNANVWFGVDGKNMNFNYPKLSSYEDFRKNSMEHRQRFSYYGDIEYIDGLDYISRVYVKDSAEEDGLQIYDNNYDLIADLSIPKGYKIAGSDEVGIALYGVDELNEVITIMKLKL